MKFTKKRLGDVPSCYAVTAFNQGDKTLFLFAPDAPGSIHIFDSVTNKHETIEGTSGGTMAIIPFPDRYNGFLAGQKFFPGFRAEDAEIAYVRNTKSGWRVNTLLKLPYLHRFDILERGGVKYLLCATLCTTKKDAADWTSPGGLYAAVLPDDPSELIEPDIIAIKMTRNHGYWRIKNKEYISALTSCDQGVFEIIPPSNEDGSWSINRLLDKPVSDIALCDIDGDGVDELAAIEPFHGNQFNIYRQTAQGYSQIYSYPGNPDFAHVAWGGRLRGENVFIGGCRGGNKELFLLRWKDGAISCEIIDKGAGPANIYVLNGKDRDLILCANHETGEAAVYIVVD